MKGTISDAVPATRTSIDEGETAGVAETEEMEMATEVAKVGEMVGTAVTAETTMDGTAATRTIARTGMEAAKTERVVGFFDPSD